MITIRPILPGDAPDWRRLWTAYLAFYETVLPEAVLESSFARLTDRAVLDYNGLLALDDGRPAGLAHYIFHRHGWRTEDVCYLQDLHVEPGLRGKGAGRALIEPVYAEADRAGRPEVYWLTEIGNAAARRLHDRIGTATRFMKYRRPSLPKA